MSQWQLYYCLKQLRQAENRRVISRCQVPRDVCQRIKKNHNGIQEIKKESQGLYNIKSLCLIMLNIFESCTVGVICIFNPSIWEAEFESNLLSRESSRIAKATRRKNLPCLEKNYDNDAEMQLSINEGFWQECQRGPTQFCLRGWPYVIDHVLVIIRVIKLRLFLWEIIKRGSRSSKTRK